MKRLITISDVLFLFQRPRCDAGSTCSDRSDDDERTTDDEREERGSMRIEIA